MGTLMGTPGLQPETGRPGRALAIRSAHSPATLPPAGYEPTDLDDSIKEYVAACGVSVKVAHSLSKQVEEAVTALVGQVQGSPEEKAELLSRLHERLSKATLNLVKSTDELTRLRSFLAGGPDQRADLNVKGELELTSMVVQAVRALGWRVVDAAGNEIEVTVA